MAYSKKEQFATDRQRAAQFAKALSHPARLTILARLAEEDTCVCGTIVDAVPLAQSTVSQHLKVLKEAGLIRGEIDGPKSCYCINHEAFAELAEQLTAFLQAITRTEKPTTCC